MKQLMVWLALAGGFEGYTVNEKPKDFGIEIVGRRNLDYFVGAADGMIWAKYYTKGEPDMVDAVGDGRFDKVNFIRILDKIKKLESAPQT